MPKAVVLVTNNSHKVREIAMMLGDDFPFPVVPYQHILGDTVTIVEDGHTFEENAIIKVRALPVNPEYVYLAEDSGIEVAALQGAPGIYSARYAGENASGEAMCHKLLRDCYGVGNRDAQYCAVMALRLPETDTIHTFTGITTGSLAHQMVGEGGFGYDPIFIPEGEDRTFAEMAPYEKIAQSHRYKALQQVKQALIEVYMGAQ